MRNLLGRFSPQIIRDLKTIGVTAQRLGCKSYIVGGVVRDLLLKQPSTDWDIVVEGDAIALARQIAREQKTRIIVYQQFGTATLFFEDGFSVDFATARSEHYPYPGALPVVRAGNLESDLFRRDFTINAIAIALSPKDFGQVRDYYEAGKDLKNKKIRVLHSDSFKDDPTRVLRAVRLSERFGFQLDQFTAKLLKKAIKNKYDQYVKPPRYFSEFRKVFSEPFPYRCLQKLSSWGGLNFLKGDVRLSMSLLSKMENGIIALRRKSFYRQHHWAQTYLICLFSSVDRCRIPMIAKRFHLTKNERLSLEAVGDIKGISTQLQARKMRPSEIYELLDPVDLEIIYFIRAVTSVKIVARRIDQFLQKWRLTELEITGQDLQKLGLPSGRLMGVVLHALLLKKIDGKIKNHKDELALAKSLGYLN